MEDLVILNKHDVSHIVKSELGLVPKPHAFMGEFNGIDVRLEHDMFLMGGAEVFYWDNQTGKFLIYDMLAGSRNCFILCSRDALHPRYAKSVDEMKEIVDRVKEELKYYAVFYHDMEVTNDLAILE